MEKWLGFSQLFCVSFHGYKAPPAIMFLNVFPLPSGSCILFILYGNWKGKEVLAPTNPTRSTGGKMDRTNKQINLPHIPTSL